MTAAGTEPVPAELAENPDGEPPERDATLLWLADLLCRAMHKPTPTAEDMAEWVEHTELMPPGTRVAVQPPRGGRWRGRIDSWTEPGSGRLMAWVVPGGDAPVAPGMADTRVLVAARFVKPA